MPHETTESATPERTASDSIIEVQPTRTRSAMDTTPIDLGSIEVLQILDEHAQVDEALDPRYDDEYLLRIHRGLVLTRAFDQRMLTMQRQG